MRIEFLSTSGETVRITFRHKRYDHGTSARMTKKEGARAVTTCTLITGEGINRRVVSVGKARCSGLDQFCRERGRIISLGRAANRVTLSPLTSGNMVNARLAMAAYRNRPRPKTPVKAAVVVQETDNA